VLGYRSMLLCRGLRLELLWLWLSLWLWLLCHWLVCHWLVCHWLVCHWLLCKSFYWLLFLFSYQLLLWCSAIWHNVNRLLCRSLAGLLLHSPRRLLPPQALRLLKLVELRVLAGHGFLWLCGATVYHSQPRIFIRPGLASRVAVYS